MFYLEQHFVWTLLYESVYFLHCCQVDELKCAYLVAPVFFLFRVPGVSDPASCRVCNPLLLYYSVYASNLKLTYEWHETFY